MTLMEFKEQLETLGIIVYHSYADLQEYPYIVYTEYAENYVHADNVIIDTIIKVQVDYFTLTDIDENKERIKKLLSDKLGIKFTYTIIFGAKNEAIHHIFDCEV